MGVDEASGLLDLAGGAGERDEVQALELAAQVAPRVAGLALGEADQQQRASRSGCARGSGLRGGGDGAQAQDALEFAERAFGLEQVLVAERDVFVTVARTWPTG